MNGKYFLAIDIGASSGRHILGAVNNGKLVLEEVFRFANGASEKNGSLFWNIEELFDKVVEGLKKCGDEGKIPYSIAIDTWGVDYALLDKNDKLLNGVYAYRDSRTFDIMDELHSICSQSELYARTGISKQTFNTVYQLYCDKKSGRLDKAQSFLMMPDYLQYLLTGVKKNEYTNASTTGLLNAKNRDWDFELIEKLGYPKNIFQKLSLPGNTVGSLKAEIQAKIGYNALVINCASHDTASAVMAVPSENPLYISSGTWSLMGIESKIENTSEAALASGFTNEGGYEKSVRFLKNIMGLWMIQRIKKEYGDKYSFTDFVAEAKKVNDFSSMVDVNDARFLMPDNMTEAVKSFCAETNQVVPETVGELVLCVYGSLAKSYAETTAQIETIMNKKFDFINIVGGGCQNVLLNELTAKYTGKKVITGPIEATALGNILAQMIAAKEIKNIGEGKTLIKKSFDISEVKN